MLGETRAVVPCTMLDVCNSLPPHSMHTVTGRGTRSTLCTRHRREEIVSMSDQHRSVLMKRLTSGPSSYMQPPRYKPKHHPGKYPCRAAGINLWSQIPLRVLLLLGNTLELRLHEIFKSGRIAPRYESRTDMLRHFWLVGPIRRRAQGWRLGVLQEGVFEV